MMLQRLVRVLLRVAAGAILLLGVGSGLVPREVVEAATSASPVHAGCYQLRLSDCKIHVEPITINVTPGKKLVYFQLIATRAVGGAQRVIYDFRPDLSNPLPYSGSTVSVSMVAQDFAATCGVAYSISLQGRDTGDSAVYNLGSTGVFTCPAMVP